VRTKTIDALYVLALIVVVVVVDVTFLRHDFVLRLITNVGVVLVFVLCYLAFLQRRWLR
jgi:hypothetical protein